MEKSEEGRRKEGRREGGGRREGRKEQESAPITPVSLSLSLSSARPDINLAKNSQSEERL